MTHQPTIMNTDNQLSQYCYQYPHAAITADCVIFGFDGEKLKILLIERGLEPYKGMWALPGGFMKINETIEQTAHRELAEETGLQEIYLEQFKVFSTVDRDPRERVVTVAFIALVRPGDYKLLAGDDASNALWFDERYLPPMAFDHADIILAARRHLAEIIRIRPIAFRLLNKIFSMSELQRVYEAINGTSYDRRNFQRKAIQTGLIEPTPTSNNCSYSVSDENYNSQLEDCFDCSNEPDEDISLCKEKSRSPRARKKFFTFRKRSSDDNEEGSIKDIFNF